MGEDEHTAPLSPRRKSDVDTKERAVRAVVGIRLS
jgi:hypothetical protein